MEIQEILDYNKRCAEFLGVDKTVSSYYLPQFGLYKNKYGEVYYEEVFMDDELKFHSDWNWIMDVVAIAFPCLFFYQNIRDYDK